jgi:hypothetical protein
MPVLYRGIALDYQAADADPAAIRQTGHLAAKSSWKNKMASPTQVRSRSSVLARLPSKVRDEIGRLPETPLTCACGDFEGAARYALRERDIPVVITFEITLEDGAFAPIGTSGLARPIPARARFMPAGRALRELLMEAVL